MPSATFTFPAGFLWGTATAAFQVEGHNAPSNWSAWVDEPGRIIQGMKPGLACDWWGGRWKEDLDRAAETGQNAHRLSVDWARIQPAPDRWDEDALDYYRQILRGVIERGMTPMVTLHHFVDPLWFAEQGGWAHPDAPRLFVAYVRKTVEALREYVSLWVTINEPNIYYFNGYLTGEFPPGKKGDLNSVFAVLTNMVRGMPAPTGRSMTSNTRPRLESLTITAPDARPQLAAAGFGPGLDRPVGDERLPRGPAQGCGQYCLDADPGPGSSPYPGFPWPELLFNQRGVL